MTKIKEKMEERM